MLNRSKEAHFQGFNAGQRERESGRTNEREGRRNWILMKREENKSRRANQRQCARRPKWTSRQRASLISRFFLSSLSFFARTFASQAATRDKKKLMMLIACAFLSPSLLSLFFPLCICIRCCNLTARTRERGERERESEQGKKKEASHFLRFFFLGCSGWSPSLRNSYLSRANQITALTVQ